MKKLSYDDLTLFFSLVKSNSVHVTWLAKIFLVAKYWDIIEKTKPYKYKLLIQALMENHKTTKGKVLQILSQQYLFLVDVIRQPTGSASEP